MKTTLALSVFLVVKSLALGACSDPNTDQPASPATADASDTTTVKDFSVFGCTSCDDGNPCTTDLCTSGGSCVHTAILCDDGNPCTTDMCSSNGCKTTALPNGSVCGAPVCTNLEHSAPRSCQDGSCAAPEMTSCDDQMPCTKDFCIPGSGCSHSDDLGIRLLSTGAHGDSARLGKIGKMDVAIYSHGTQEEGFRKIRLAELDPAGHALKSWPVDMKPGAKEQDSVTHVVDAVDAVHVVSGRLSNFIFPTGVAVARVAAGGKVTATATWPGPGPDCATGDGEGGVIVCSFGVKTWPCRRFDGNLTPNWTIDLGSGDAGTALAYDAVHGHLLVADGVSSLRRFTVTNGTEVSKFSIPEIDIPHGITVTESGVAVVVGLNLSDYARRIAAIDPGGKLLWLAKLPAWDLGGDSVGIAGIPAVGYALAFGLKHPTKGAQFSTIRTDLTGHVVQQNLLTLPPFNLEQAFDLRISGNRWMIGWQLGILDTKFAAAILRCDAWGTCACPDSRDCAGLPATGCNDNNACTLDRCVWNGCKPAPAMDGTSCGSTGQTCLAGVCTP